jgi:predicted nuclease with TOPRIM domain
MNRVLVALLFALPAVALCPSSASAQNNRIRDLERQVQQLQREVEILSEEKNRLTDESIRSAQRYDMERRRLQDEKEELIAENARLTRRVALLEARLESLGESVDDEEDPSVEEIERVLRDRQVTLNFADTPLEDCLMFMQDIGGLNIVVDRGADIDDLTVSLRLRDVSLRNALLLMLASDEELTYAIEDGVIHIRRNR